MAHSEPTHLIVGFVTKPHGIKGEVFMGSLTDHPEGIFSPGVVLFPGDRDGGGLDPDRPPLRIETIRPFRDGFLILFGGIRDRNDANTLRGTYLFLPVDALSPLADDEVFYHQLLGMTVETVDGETVGRVQEVYEMEPSDLLEVRTAAGTILIPYNREVVVDADREGKRLVIDPPAGLLELDR